MHHLATAEKVRDCAKFLPFQNDWGHSGPTKHSIPQLLHFIYAMIYALLQFNLQAVSWTSWLDFCLGDATQIVRSTVILSN